jgi:hypothetical protein
VTSSNIHLHQIDAKKNGLDAAAGNADHVSRIYSKCPGVNVEW